jgi:hypothetical protein
MKNDGQLPGKSQGTNGAYSSGKRQTLPQSEEMEKKSNEENLFPRML